MILGRKLIIHSFNAKEKLKSKFKIIEVIIQKRPLFLTNFGHITYKDFIRKAVESSIIAFDIY